MKWGRAQNQTKSKLDEKINEDEQGEVATKWGREGLVGCGLSPIVLIGAGLGGREREVRMGESLGWRGKEEDGGEKRERNN